MSWTVGRRVGVTLVAVAAPGRGRRAVRRAARDPDAHFAGLLNAPPTRPHAATTHGAWHAPFIYRWRLANQLEQRYEEDRSARSAAGVVCRRASGRLCGRRADAAVAARRRQLRPRRVQPPAVRRAHLARSRRVPRRSARCSLGASLGGLAGYAGGSIDDVLMRATDFVMVLPAIYVVLALRAVLPLVLDRRHGLRAAHRHLRDRRRAVHRARRAGIVRSERRLDYAAAAQALGASHVRLLAPHLLPAARGFLAVQITLLVPAFIVAEATLSYVGLGFPDPVASWGTMLHDASNIRVFADFPWLLSPAAAMFLVVLGVNLVLQHVRRGRLQSILMNLVRRLRSRSPRRLTTAIGVDTVASARRSARVAVTQPLHRLRRARFERRSGVAGRLRIAITSIAAAREAMPRDRTLHRRHRPRIDAGDDHGEQAGGGARRRRRARAHARVLQEPDDERRVRSALHGGRRRVAGAGAALQLHGGDRREPAAGGGRRAWRRIPNIVGMKESGGDVAQIADLVSGTPRRLQRAGRLGGDASTRRCASAPPAASSRWRMRCSRALRRGCSS